MRRLAANLCAALALLGGATAQEEGFDPKADFEAFWSLYDEHYALFGVKGVDWDAVGAVYRPRVTEETTRDELFAVFEAATGHLNDVHVTVQGEGHFARSGGRSLGQGDMDDGRFSLSLIEDAYADGPLAVLAGGTMRAGLVDGLGYLRIEAFKHPTTSEGAMARIAARFAEADVQAVIVDVRHDGGGSDAVAWLVASRFADRVRVVMTAQARVGGALGEPSPWEIAPTEDALGVPVVVLVDDRTISAAENFALMMRAFGHVAIVGEQTAGALADTYKHQVGAWTFGVPSNVLRDADGVSWEGIGVVPDLWARTEAADVAAGRDPALEAAIAFARAGGRAERDRLP